MALAKLFAICLHTDHHSQSVDIKLDERAGSLMFVCLSRTRTAHVSLMESEVVLVDGVGYPAVGSIVGVDNADVAKGARLGWGDTQLTAFNPRTSSALSRIVHSKLSRLQDNLLGTMRFAHVDDKSTSCPWYTRLGCFTFLYAAKPLPEVARAPVLLLCRCGVGNAVIARRRR
eukprot:3412157-Amphidinium_carterae.1